MASHSSTLAWKIPWTEGPGGVSRSQTQLGDFTFTFHFHALEKEMATHSSVLAWRIPGKGEPSAAVYGVTQSRTRLKRLSSSSRREEKCRAFLIIPTNSLVAQTIKHLPAMRETQVQSIGWEDLLEKEMATHSTVLAWKIHGRRSLVHYSGPWGRRESDKTERLHFHFLIIRDVLGLMLLWTEVYFLSTSSPKEQNKIHRKLKIDSFLCSIDGFYGGKELRVWRIYFNAFGLGLNQQHKEFQSWEFYGD